MSHHSPLYQCVWDLFCCAKEIFSPPLLALRKVFATLWACHYCRYSPLVTQITHPTTPHHTLLPNPLTHQPLNPHNHKHTHSFTNPPLSSQAAYLYYLERRPAVFESGLLLKLPPRMLQTMISHIHIRDIKSIKIFEDCEDSFVSKIIAHSKPHHAMVRMIVIIIVIITVI